MKHFLENNEIIEALGQRYAVKKFEKRDIDTTELEKTVKEILRLTPTSFWLEAYKFIIPKSPEIREQLKACSWWQWQVTDADLFVIFAVPTDFDRSYIEKHMQKMVEVRNMPEEKAQAIANFMDDKIIQHWSELWIANYEEWLTRQAYIWLGNLMTALAVLWVDSCPLEWIDPGEYNSILWLNEKNLTAKVALAIWKRHPDDKYQNEKKVRFDTDQLFIEI